MPEYLAPGVYVEEVSFRSKSIEGVSTTTTGFVGPAAYGPLDLVPEIVTSVEEFGRTYGSRDQLVFQDAAGRDLDPSHNDLWHAVRAFFAEGGRRLYVARVFRPVSATDDGRAHASFPTTATAARQIMVQARFPGRLGNMRVRFTLRLGPNMLGRERIPNTEPAQFRTTVGALGDRDVVWIDRESSPPASPGAGAFYRAEQTFDAAIKDFRWSFTAGTTTLRLDD